jgi:Bacterial Ig-like domain (group 3)
MNILNLPARGRRRWALLAGASLLSVLLPLGAPPAAVLAAPQQDLLFAALSNNGLTPDTIQPARAGLPLALNVPEIFHSNGSQAGQFPGGFKTVASPPVPAAGFTAVVVALTSLQSAPAFAKVDLLVKNGTTGNVITSQSNVMIDNIPLDQSPAGQHCQVQADTVVVVFQFTLAPPVNAVVVGPNDDLQLVITPTQMSSQLDICVNDFTFYTGLGLIVEPLPVPITLAPASDTRTVGMSETLTATVVGTNSSPKSGTTVTFSVLSGPDAGTTGTDVTDSNGHAIFTYTNTTAAGSDVVRASFTDSTGTHNSNQSVINWVRESTTLSYTGGTTSDFNDPATLSAVLDDSGGNPIAGQTVTFTIGGQACSGTTDAAGQASCVIVPDAMAGSYAVDASYAGSVRFQPSSVSAAFTVTREETNLSYTGGTNFANGGSAVLSAVLEEDGQTAVAGRTISFTLGVGASAQSCSGVTDATGSANCVVALVNQPPGAGTVAASFAGDGFYLPASDSQSTLVFAFLGRGSFVIGDKNGAIGAAVTFWGAQWAKDNVLGSSAAPPSFKGFAENPTAPACGTGWGADPGNSSGPPAGPLPAFMAVIVTSSAGKSRTGISGNTVHIVVVRTNPGYAPNPGHAGTGTVIAEIC